MDSKSNPYPISSLRSWSKVADLCGALVGTVVVIGWVFDIQGLESLRLGWTLAVSIPRQTRPQLEGSQNKAVLRWCRTSRRTHANRIPTRPEFSLRPTTGLRYWFDYLGLSARVGRRRLSQATLSSSGLHCCFSVGRAEAGIRHRMVGVHPEC